MKILTIGATPFFSDRGCHIRIYNKAKYLQKRGHDVLIATYHLGNTPAEVNVVRIGNVLWYTKHTPGFAWGKIWLDLKLLILVWKQIRSFSPDIIHAHLFEGIAIARIALCMRRKKIPILADLQGDLAAEFQNYNKKNSVAKSFFLALSGSVLHWADTVVLSSENSRAAISSIWKKPNRPMVIADGIDMELFNNRVQSVDAAILEWNDTSPVLLYTGSLEPGKGIMELVELFCTLDTPWKLLIVGSGSLAEPLQILIRRSSRQNMKLVGRIDYFSLPKYLRIATVAIDPKHDSTESSGKIMNYLAAGLPIICFDSPMNRSLLGSQGLYIHSLTELPAVLTRLTVQIPRVQYDTEAFNEQVIAGKLENVFIQTIAQFNNRSC